MVRPRRAEQCLPQEDVTPQRDAGARNNLSGRSIPAAARSPLREGPSGYALAPPFARSLTRQTACKAPSHPGCGEIGCSWRCAPWHRSPGYDFRRSPYDHPDFNSNALSEDLFSGSLV